MKNVLIPDELHNRVKLRAVISGTTIQEITEEALRIWLRCAAKEGKSEEAA